MGLAWSEQDRLGLAGVERMGVERKGQDWQAWLGWIGLARKGWRSRQDSNLRHSD